MAGPHPPKPNRVNSPTRNGQGAPKGCGYRQNGRPLTPTTRRRHNPAPEGQGNTGMGGYCTKYRPRPTPTPHKGQQIMTTSLPTTLGSSYHSQPRLPEQSAVCVRPSTMPYSAEITQKLDRDLVDVFDETGFPEELAKYCADNGVTKVMAFADLAESKAEIVKIMARVAALDAEDPIKCQPIKSAWRIADARAKAALDAAATGKEVETIRIMGPTERAKVDAAAEKRFSFRWPPTLMPCSALLAKIEAVYRKFLKETPRIQEARSILDKGALTSQVTFPGSRGRTTSWAPQPRRMAPK